MLTKVERIEVLKSRERIFLVGFDKLRDDSFMTSAPRVRKYPNFAIITVHK